MTMVNNNATTSNPAPQASKGPASGLHPPPVSISTAEYCGPPVGAHAEGLLMIVAPSDVSAIRQAPKPTPKNQFRITRNRSRRAINSSSRPDVTEERFNVRVERRAAADAN
jgi:hypothetical protein